MNSTTHTLQHKKTLPADDSLHYSHRGVSAAPRRPRQLPEEGDSFPLIIVEKTNSSLRNIVHQHIFIISFLVLFISNSSNNSNRGRSVNKKLKQHCSISYLWSHDRTINLHIGHMVSDVLGDPRLQCRNSESAS